MLFDVLVGGFVGNAPFACPHLPDLNSKPGGHVGVSPSVITGISAMCALTKNGILLNASEIQMVANKNTMEIIWFDLSPII